MAFTQYHITIKVHQKGELRQGSINHLEYVCLAYSRRRLLLNLWMPRGRASTEYPKSSGGIKNEPSNSDLSTEAGGDKSIAARYTIVGHTL